MKQIINELSEEVTKLKDRGEIGLFAELKLQNIINKLKESINYTHYCTELKDKYTPHFGEWLDAENYEYVRNGIYRKNGTIFNKLELIQEYNEYLKAFNCL